MAERAQNNFDTEAYPQKANGISSSTYELVKYFAENGFTDGSGKPIIDARLQHILVAYTTTNISLNDLRDPAQKWASKTSVARSLLNALGTLLEHAPEPIRTELEKLGPVGLRQKGDKATRAPRRGRFSFVNDGETPDGENVLDEFDESDEPDDTTQDPDIEPEPEELDALERESPDPFYLDHLSSSQDSPNTLRNYLREIGKIPLLSSAQEIALAKRIENGKLEKEKPIHQQNSSVVQDANDAQREFIKANLRLVVFVAKRYRGRGLELLDLIQEGNIGLMRAVNKFDLTRGNKFATVGIWWIRQAITRALADKGHAIRLPVHMQETVNRLTRTSQRLVQELGRNPTDTELAEAMGISPKRVDEIRGYFQLPKSLEEDMYPGEQDAGELGEYIKDTSPQPDEITSYYFLREAVRDTLNTLTPREQEVIRRRFGLGYDIPQTLEEVGKELKVTRERIRQIEEKVLKKLRRPHTAEQLIDFLE